MSTKSEEIVVHIDPVDVSVKVKEYASSIENISDSGLSIAGNSSVDHFGTDTDVSPVKNVSNEDIFELPCVDSLSTQSSLSSPSSDDIGENMVPDFDFQHHSTGDDVTFENGSLSKDLDQNNENICENILNNKDNICKPLTTSTISLNEDKSVNNLIIKSTISKSVENLSNIKTNENENLNSCEKNLNAEKILSQFASQKTKVSAVQKIPENSHVLDQRYSRIPKELLSQDIGSIVKNVHGIFSSVSGSLKYAYTHRSNPQKQIKIEKSLPNGKLMNDIFEDDCKTETSSKNSKESLEVIDPEKTIEGVNSNLESPIKSMEPDSEGEIKKDLLQLQVESLERLLFELRKENASLRDKVKAQGVELQQKDQIYKEVECKLDLMNKRVEQADREMNAAVMRYASVECTAIEAKKTAENALKAEKAALSEVELMQAKLKSAHSEKQRICQMYDDKCHEVLTSERELAKVREDMKELEGRLKWTQSKLRMEMEAYKESSERAEKLSQQVTELEAARDAAVVNATDSVKAKQFESELKECQAALILCRHERDELEKRVTSQCVQLDACSRDRDNTREQLERVSAEVEQLKQANLRLEEEAAELAALRAKAALADTLSAQLQRETARANQAEESLAEARAISETCCLRESAALSHSASVTAAHVATSASLAQCQAEARALAADNISLREQMTSLEQECTKLQTALNEETERRNKENRVLARKVAELTEELSEVTKKLEWEKGENGVLKKKHASAVKELNRELQRAVKRCEQLEAKIPNNSPSTRTGSISSLSSSETVPEERLQSEHSDNLPDIQVREPDRQTLIERIVSLQRAAARRAERCEFLEEHSRQLTGELRNKARLLRALLCEIPAGAVGSALRDANKKEIARLGGGAMAAVWGGDPSGITPDLALQMTTRLQAVLEDTLLKNITLKENMDTLGAEISRLKEQIKSADTK